MNIENINKTIDFLKTRKWHSVDYTMHDDCMVGMIGDALHGDRGHSRSDDALPFGKAYIADAFDIALSTACNIYVMNQSDAINLYPSTKTFAEMTTDKQNRVLISMLEGLRDSGGTSVFWNFDA